ncbi:hypothetical protein NDU88_001595 [Pleurodeles waltl]|uniref:Uncharacterized protein n=1 Tax=Pleurodeles waltl TaxID=8319 RepID=A0AAV7MLF9_PLEWA|nr:hypothetical protein NDU88_001595 [Pleurodeles waltl]
MAKDKCVYKAGDKAGKLLAWLGSKEREGLFVREIGQDSGNRVTGSNKVAEDFADYMQAFYNARPLAPESKVLDFIKDCPVKHLQSEQMEELEADITVEEMVLAMGQIQAGKVAGPNWLPIGFFH